MRRLSLGQSRPGLRLAGFEVEIRKTGAEVTHEEAQRAEQNKEAAVVAGEAIRQH